MVVRSGRVQRAVRVATSQTFTSPFLPGRRAPTARLLPSGENVTTRISGLAGSCARAGKAAKASAVSSAARRRRGLMGYSLLLDLTGQVPDEDGGVVHARDQPLAVGREGQRARGLGNALHGAGLLAGGRVPQADAPPRPLAAGGNQLAVGGEGDGAGPGARGER